MIALGIVVALVLAGIVATVVTLSIQRTDAIRAQAQAERARDVITMSAEGLRKTIKERDHEIYRLNRALDAAHERINSARARGMAGLSTAELLDALAGVERLHEDADGDRGGAGTAGGSPVVPDGSGSASGLITGDLG